MSSATAEQTAVSGSITVEPVQNKRGVLEFLKFPFQLYRHDPNWVPPFIEERRDFLDPKKNPFFDHARLQLFVARRAGEVVGTIAGVIDDYYNQFNQEHSGGFGFFEAIDDQQVAGALLRAVEEWLRGQGMTLIRGPLNLSINQEIGTLIDGFDESPMIMMTYNPRYYQRLIESQGYRKAQDVYAYIGDTRESLEQAPEKLSRVAEKFMAREGIRIRKVNMKNFDKEIERAKRLYNQLLEHNWGYVPMTDAEFEHLARGLKLIIDPELITVAETADGEPIGLALALPDIHQALKRSGGGHMFPFGILKFLWHKRKVNQVRLTVLGVVEGYRGKGIDAYLYLELFRNALARGYRRIEGSWVLESNTMMNRIIERIGGKRYKTYRVFEKDL
jgi:GNAT superfamily N-acetyltransferase